MFDNLYKIVNKTNYRASSWDTSGKNNDYIRVKPNKSKILADIQGPGIIRHMYFTTIHQNPLEFRWAVIKMYWDFEQNPSVEVPLGDFFGVSNCRVRPMNSLMITVNRGGEMGSYGFNLYFPMPFSKHAKIEVENQGPEVLGGMIRAFWYHIDYETLSAPWPKDVGYFHAWWNREKITKIADDVPKDLKNQSLWTGKNLTGKNNYVALDTEGDGHLVGILLSIDNLGGGWYGEGDDMVFIDDDTWPPSIPGTGTEEIFGGGASPKYEFSGPYAGFHLIENSDYSGHNGMYRWYIHDTIRFKKKIRWTIEHGHANNFENDYSSVAFWYQKEPHKVLPSLPAVKDRIPRMVENYDEIWKYSHSISAKFLNKRVELGEKLPHDIDNLYQDAMNDIMLGKYQIAYEKLKKLDEICP